MIVADTNLIAYFLIPGNYTGEARAVYQKDPGWVAPALWRSEFRNVLILSLRRRVLTFADTLEVMEKSEKLMGGRERATPSARILRLAADSGCSAYDCEFVALAQDLGISLVTSDKGIVARFKPTAVSMREFCG